MYTVDVSRAGFVLKNFAPHGSGRIEMAKIADGHAESAEIDRGDGNRWKIGLLLQKGSKHNFVLGQGGYKNTLHIDTGDGDVIVVQDAMWMKYVEDAGWVEWCGVKDWSTAIRLEY